MELVRYILASLVLFSVGCVRSVPEAPQITVEKNEKKKGCDVNVTIQYNNKMEVL